MESATPHPKLAGSSALRPKNNQNFGTPYLRPCGLVYGDQIWSGITHVGDVRVLGGQPRPHPNGRRSTHAHTQHDKH